MKMSLLFCVKSLVVAVLFVGNASAAIIDGENIPGEGLTLRAVQNSATGFGNATGGGQDSAGGSELNALYADVDSGVLKLGITGNLEANFNKLFIFFDAVPGGESTLSNDNVDGGFNEIQNLAGLSFGGPTMDHGLRIEVGGGFFGINAFDLIDNTALSVWSGGGPGDLPLVNAAGGGGVTAGWNNANTAGVSDSDASTALTATTGFEFEIDMNTLFGSSDQLVYVSALITNPGGDFVSNQILPGISGGNLGSPNGAMIGAVPIPEPSGLIVCIVGLLGVLGARKL